MKEMKLYKVLNKDLTSPFQNFKFKVGKQYVCKDFDDDKNMDCSRGFYAVDIDGLPYSFNVNRVVYECEVGGKSVEIDQFKRRYEKFKLVKEISHFEIKKLDYDLIGNELKEYSEMMTDIEEIL